ncbi:hypothetical protein KFE25_005965 [Diacronema lutheri]|uniref:AAA+ ATPase domain-containing protein n=1 Tax=Diacronema lutheri TaxID=2081491 RepID=A0A8J5Y1A7_DIALT|nr:hypothetical protein KFE25_005965 [Diacronema lutheri]
MFSGGDAGAEAQPPSELPWLEKYRPIEVKDIVGNEETVARLGIIAQEGNMPNIILSGPPGTGKTTSVLCVSRQLLGAAWRDAVLELNASDDRGIDVVRNRIKGFAQKKVTLPPGRHKIVILDEADSMTTGAQQALRRTMEIHSGTTRFALACNISNKIIEPIQSRCAVLRYTKLSDEQVLKRLLTVLKLEATPYDDSGLDALIFTAEGDMRQALNNAQATAAGFGKITSENVMKVCDQPHPLLLKQLIDAALDGDFDGAHNVFAQLWDEGYAAIDVVGSLFRIAKYHECTEESKLELIREIGLCHMRVLEGLDSFLQMSALVALLCLPAAKRKRAAAAAAAAAQSRGK